ncbi:MAG: hypothetical protein GWO11_02845, partial [Desulfuromonadales bacterium]|nr:hypothetical protein [Desulfuromonadales bacterium]NIR33407.1 hypothetical protein [Desulfuromonadales bacterium]NIS43395.1 hypothetical protein [Desulfuromonadales bacterium]
MLQRCILIALALLFPLSSAAQTEKTAKKGPPAALVVTAAVRQAEIRSPLTLVGTAEATRLTTLAGEVSGRVVSIPVE